MLDRTTLHTILERHFPTASAARVREAVEDIQLLELLTNERVDIEWEDSVREAATPSLAVFSSTARHRS
jgi:hypothetical protein